MASIVTDELVLRMLAQWGIDKNHVELWHDYAPHSLGKEHSPYAKFYRDLKSNKKFMVVSGLPKVKPDGIKIECGWTKKGKRYQSKPNLFSAIVEGTQIKVTALSDQPSGTKQGDYVLWQPQLFLNGVEQTRGEATLLETDPDNEHYRQNVLEWDYGICKRRIRLVEGALLGRWVFPTDPHGEIRIKHNQVGETKLALGEFAINDDEELVPKEVFIKADYPFIAGESATYYSYSSDGMIQNQNANYLTCQAAGTGTFVRTNQTHENAQNERHSVYYINRLFLYFDSSGLPDDTTITAATLGVYGSGDGEQGETDIGYADLQLFEGTQADPLTVTDFANFEATALSDDFTNWEYKINSSGYNTITLNAAGRGIISKTSVTKFALRVKGDVNAHTPPTGSTRTDIFLNEEGTGYQPKLVVTYSIGPIGKSSWAFRNAGPGRRVRRKAVFYPDLVMGSK